MAELTTIARPYAKAVFAHAVECKAEEAWLGFLQRCAILVSDETMIETLKNPGVNANLKVKIMSDLTATTPADGADAFLDALAYYGRMLALPEIATEYERLLAGRQQALDVTITSAFELSNDEIALLESKLKSKYAGKTIRIETAVDQSLIGGFEIRSSDTVIDATVKGRLAKIAEALTA